MGYAYIKGSNKECHAQKPWSLVDIKGPILYFGLNLE
jgi:hypothetical protein